MQEVNFVILNLIVDLIFFMDILICFRTTFLDENTGFEEISTMGIARNYLLGNFLVDFFATIPIDWIVELIRGHKVKSLQFFGLLKLGRLLRINRIIRFLNASRDFKASAKLMNLVFFLIVYLHCYACVLWSNVVDGKVWTPYYLQENVAESIHFLYYDDQVEVSSKYLVCLYQSVQTMGGGDFGPMNSRQTILAAFGVFMAAYINANIFGELTMILQSIGEEEQKFENKMSFCNNTMINLNLEEQLRNDVRRMVKMHFPMEINMDQMIFLIEIVPPSLQRKIIQFQYTKYLNQYKAYRAKSDFLKILAITLQVNFYLPEHEIIRINDENFRMVFITGSGECNVYQHFQ